MPTKNAQNVDSVNLGGVGQERTSIVKLFFSYSPSHGIHPPPPHQPLSQGVDFESFFGRFRVDLENDWKSLKIGNGSNTVSESTVSNTELSYSFVPSPSSGERIQWVPLSPLFVRQSELTEFLAELA